MIGVLYRDKNSIIFLLKDVNQLIPSLREYFGDLTKALHYKEIGWKKVNSEGKWIKKTVHFGPKNYTFRINGEK